MAINHTLVWLCALLVVVSGSIFDDDDENDVEKRLYSAKMDLWSRGAFKLDESAFLGSLWQDRDEGFLRHAVLAKLEEEATLAPLRLGPVRKARRDALNNNDECLELDCPGSTVWKRLLGMRGGGDTVHSQAAVEAKLEELGQTYGQEFRNAIEKNKQEHKEDCEVSCEAFYCADPSNSTEWDADGKTKFTSYSFGSIPPEDFAEDFGFPLDLIKVTAEEPLFSAKEAAKVIEDAESEEVHLNEYTSGKYKLGGDWLVNLPKTREWFNRRLESTFFPLLAYLFPEIISSQSVLRAHSVSLLKYNSSHPRTDVHVDNGILAMTIAMTPQDNYVGGGTFFEHMGVDNVLPMDVGHGTFRPGSVRHGGHKVTSGTRYILGAFLLLADRVEHVRRLKNRGTELRRSGDNVGAAKHFEWALAINPKCTTCLKDWTELLMSQKKFSDAEAKIRAAIEYLEEKDSDALFTLGVILSEQGRDDESIEAYTKSVNLNSGDDAELCYNLAVKYGGKGKIQEEMKMYAQATSIDPTFGKAWMNWGVALAESGNLDDAEVMFLKAMKCPDSDSKAMMNLALVQEKKGMDLARSGDMMGAKKFLEQAANYLDTAKPLLDSEMATGKPSEEAVEYIAQFGPQRLQCHRSIIGILAGLKEYVACEAELRNAIKAFPQAAFLWEALAKVLDLMGKPEEAAQARETFSRMS